MATAGDLIRRLREERGMSQSDVAKALGISQVAIAKIESGQTVKSKHMPDLEQFLRAPVQQLPRPTEGDAAPAFFTDEMKLALEAFVRSMAQNQQAPSFREPPRLMNKKDTMPVYAAAEGGNGHLIVTTEEVERVPRPYTLEGVKDAYGILVTGDSMSPAYEPGDIAWVNPRLPALRDTDCILYSADENGDEHRATIKHLVSWTASKWNLLQHNPKKEFPLERDVWRRYHRVVGNFRRR